MLIPTTTVIALRCQFCGRMSFQGLSLFQFSRTRSHRFECTCGEELFSIISKDRKVFWLQFICSMCESRHVIRLAKREIWSSQVFDLYCEDTGLEVGHTGPREAVRQRVQEQDKTLAEMAQQLGFTDYFENPDVMYQVLEHLHKIAENGNLYCSCGNQDVEIEIFPDFVELRCDHCLAKVTVMARDQQDLDTVQKRWEVDLRLVSGDTGNPSNLQSHHKK